MPLRLLNDFAIYDLITYDLVHVGALLQLSFAGPTTEYGASGIVEAWVDDDDDPEAEEEDEISFPGQRVKLSKIMEINVHHVSNRTQKLDGFVPTNFRETLLRCFRRPERYISARNLRGTFSTSLRLHICLIFRNFGFNIAFSTSWYRVLWQSQT
jgi:hypothetical protein